MKKWPAHYPIKCPPAIAETVSGVIYRFTTRATPNLKDFHSYYEHNPNRDWGSDACNARGLSVFTCAKACELFRKRVPAMKKKKLASATLNSSDGLILNTPSNISDNHHTFWPQLKPNEMVIAFKSVDIKVGIK